MNIKPEQLRNLHGLLNRTGLMEEKETLVLSFSGGREKSSRGLTYQEAGALITHLKSLDGSHKMRRKIISMAHELGWKIPGTKKINMEAINTWCKTYGYGKKELNEYTEQELPKLVTQFQNGPYKFYLTNL